MMTLTLIFDFIPLELGLFKMVFPAPITRHKHTPTQQDLSLDSPLQDLK